jgi:hypothetical protein
MLRSKRLGVIAASILISAGALLSVSTAPAGAVAASTQTAIASTATRGSNLTGRIIPNITWRLCTGTNSYATWVHLDTLTGAGLLDYCYGGLGTWRFNSGNNDVRTFCSGNNSGLYYYTQGGVTHPFYFHPGELVPFAGSARAVSLIISGWSGSDTCPAS